MISKLLLLLLVIGGVIAAVRVSGMMRRAQARPPASGSRQVRKTEELLKCSGCGAYVPAGSPDPCGRDGCPTSPERRRP